MAFYQFIAVAVFVQYMSKKKPHQRVLNVTALFIFFRNT